MAARPPAEVENVSENGTLHLVGKFMKTYWKITYALTWPLSLVPMMITYNRPETRCAVTILTMAGYWITECVPMAITSLIPLVFFPLFGILSTADTCSCYMNDTIMVFIGGLILAVAIEHSNLHLRIALGVMRTVGCTHGKLLGGLCAVTTFISMWVSNTAATAMMVPIIFAVLNELEQAGLCRVFEDKADPEHPGKEPERHPTKITKAYLMAAAYCATFGGTGTIVGTGTNLTFKGIYESTFPKAEGINFMQWMVASMPQMIVNTLLTWIYLRIVFMGYLRPGSQDAQIANIGEEGETITNRRTESIPEVMLTFPKTPYVIQERYKELGGMTFHEAAVASLFSLCVFLWIFRKPGFVKGWSEMITDISVRDSTPVIFVSILMFLIPKDLNFLNSFNKDPATRPTKPSEGLITWEVIEKKMPWSLMFLLGGGFAISKGSVASCLAKRMGEALVPLKSLPPVLILFLVSFFVGTITEFTSNVGIANITLPVVAQMCVAMEMHPMYLMVPATIMCSYSFRLPVGTPPNAIITVVGNIPTKWLMMAGCGPSIYAIFVQGLFFITWGTFVYDIHQFPEWAKDLHSSDDNPQCN